MARHRKARRSSKMPKRLLESRAHKLLSKLMHRGGHVPGFAVKRKVRKARKTKHRRSR